MDTYAMYHEEKWGWVWEGNSLHYFEYCIWLYKKDTAKKLGIDL